MDNLQLNHVPIAKTGMLIRKPVEEVFEAFVNPDITTRFFHQEQWEARSRQASPMGLGNVWHLDSGHREID